MAVVIYNEGQPGRTDVLTGSLGAPGITIPVVGTSFAVAQQLFCGDAGNDLLGGGTEDDDLSGGAGRRRPVR